MSAILKVFPHRNLLNNLLGFHLSYLVSIMEEAVGWECMFVVTEKRGTL